VLKKKGGFYARDPSRDKMEELVLEWDLIDVVPSEVNSCGPISALS
jgi:hypothetical protein